MSFYTDIAYEKCDAKMQKRTDNLDYGCEEFMVDINSTFKERAYEKPRGKYYLLNCPNLDLLAPVVYEYIISRLSNYLKRLFSSTIQTNNKKILVVGLGNEKLVSDSLGAMTVNKLCINCDLNNLQNKLFAFIPGVSSNTGMSSDKLIKCVVKEIRPDLVILVDSLCALSTSRLGNSFQITDNGLKPGGAINEDARVINSKFLGVPTVSIGVPLVVKTETIIGEILSKISEDVDCDMGIIKNVNNFLVTPKDIDRLVSIDADIIACAITSAVFDVNTWEQKSIKF